MKGSRFSAEQIIAILREQVRADVAKKSPPAKGRNGAAGV
jgi:hypothetical protein